MARRLSFFKGIFVWKNLGIKSSGEIKGPAIVLLLLVGHLGVAVPVFASRVIVLCTYHYIVFIPVS